MSLAPTTTAPKIANEPGAIKWLHDEYAAALAEAKREQKPLFMDMWAPWCHTCLAMKHYVFSDPGLAPLADRFVWLAVDTDKEANAEVVHRYPVSVWPTFYTVSPADESVQALHMGAASLNQLRELLAQGEQGYLEQRAQRGVLEPSSALGAVRRGDQATAGGDPVAAAAAYRKALATADANWPRTPEVAVKLAAAVVKAGDPGQCQKLAQDGFPWAARGNTASVADFAYEIGECAKKLADESARRRIVAAAVASLDALLGATKHQLSLDDRSDALRIARELELAIGNEQKARQRAEEQRALLDSAIQTAPSPYAAMTYNWPLAEVAIYLGQGESAIPALERSVAALPGEYDPPYRLAWLYLHTGKLKQARPFAQRALELAYGPRRARIAELLADICKASGDIAGERSARQLVVEIYERLPDQQRRRQELEAAKRALARVGDKS
jgi:thioredoxin-like negative regulator of GroEL